ncbi:MAG: ATP-grasp domain-containing protein [bacterium]
MNSLRGIVILSEKDDFNAMHLYKSIKKKDIHCIFIDSRRLSFDYDIYLNLSGENIRFLNTNALKYSYFIRAVNLVPLNPYHFSDRKLYTQYRNYYSLFFSFVEIVNSLGVKVVNPPSTFWCHYFKPFTYKIAKDTGFDIPLTIVTPSFRQVYKIYKEYASKKQMVYKPVAGGKNVKILRNIEEFPKDDEVYIFQEVIHGKNVRVFTLGDNFTAGFYLMYDTEKSIDYRDLDPDEVKVCTCEIPNQLSDKCIKLARTIGLRFSGIDLIFDGDKYYFLDINPAPMFYGFEYQSGYPLTDKIIDYLLCVE